MFATAAVLAIAIWVGSQHRMQGKTETAIIDLRPIALTRGGQAVISAAEVLTIDAKTNRLRLILPAGSEGHYECEILTDQQTSPLLYLSGEASLQNRQVILDLRMQADTLPVGQYTLALQKQGSEWMYYRLVQK